MKILKSSMLILLVLVPFATGHAQVDTLRVACIGNSITEGALLTSPSTEGYPAELQNLLGDGYQVKNYGVGGRTLLKNGDFPFRDETAFKRAMEFDPHIVTILLGTNDSKPQNWEDYKDEFISDYISLIDTFRTLDNNVRFILGYPPPAFSNLGNIRDSVIFNEVIPKIEEIASRTHNPVVDFYSAMTGDTDLFPDGIHPDAAGHDKIAALFLDAILALPPAVDTLPPYFTKIPDSPFTVYDSARALVEVATAGPSWMKYSATDQDYDGMENLFGETGGRLHRTLIAGEHGQSYTYYLRAIDAAGNKMAASAAISFSFDTTRVLYNWTESGYGDSTWSTGRAVLGYGGTTAYKTVLAEVRTAYFRKTLQVDMDPSLLGLGILVKGRDGAVVYLNGHEVGRVNLPENTEIEFESYALEPMNMNKVVLVTEQNGLEYLKNGENTVSVEMHISETGSQLSFDSQGFDNNSKIYFPLGSEWLYYDKGNRPENQLVSKKSQSIVGKSSRAVRSCRLFQNYPNPFNPGTQIRFILNEPCDVTLDVFDISGARVSRIHERKSAGQHTVPFDGKNLASGIYYYRLCAGSFTEIRRMVLVK